MMRAKKRSAKGSYFKAVLCSVWELLIYDKSQKRSAKGSNFKEDNSALPRLGIIKSLTRANKKSAKGSNVKEDNVALHRARSY